MIYVYINIYTFFCKEGCRCHPAQHTSKYTTVREQAKRDTTTYLSGSQNSFLTRGLKPSERRQKRAICTRDAETNRASGKVYSEEGATASNRETATNRKHLPQAKNVKRVMAIHSHSQESRRQRANREYTRARQQHPATKI